MKGITSQIQ